jgi:hypothetical protein
MPQSASLTAKMLADRRDDEREFVNLAPALLESAAMTETVYIVNVARHGFLARSRLGYRSDDRVKLRFQNLPPIACRVVWNGKGMIGAHFLEPVDIESLPRTE